MTNYNDIFVYIYMQYTISGSDYSDNNKTIWIWTQFGGYLIFFILWVWLNIWWQKVVWNRWQAHIKPMNLLPDCWPVPGWQECPACSKYCSIFASVYTQTSKPKGVIGCFWFILSILGRLIEVLFHHMVPFIHSPIIKWQLCIHPFAEFPERQESC